MEVAELRERVRYARTVLGSIVSRTLESMALWLPVVFVMLIGSAVIGQEQLADSYDFVIVGAGTSGSVLANRLSEVTDWKILLLEAGHEEMWLTDVPLLASLIQLTSYNWGYRTEPASNNSQGYCLAMIDRRCNWPRGKALGGSSVINFMIYTRGARADYDEWEALGNPGWSYDNVLPYFLKSENSRLRSSKQDEPYHSRGGYLDVSEVPYVSKLRKPFLEAASELGYRVNDYNARNIMGFSPVQANLRAGRRVSAAKAFLEPVMGRNRRTNLRVLQGATATRLLFDKPNSRRVNGVQFRWRGRSRVARARREVLLCAGALNSPQLLMLSGVGPSEHLASLGIPLRQDLPVGLNLQDHVSMAALTFLVNDSVSIVESRLMYNPKHTFDYLLRGRGPFTSPGGAEALAFVDTNAILGGGGEASGRDYPDIELVLGTGALTGDLSGGLRSFLGLTENFEREVFAEYKGRDAFSIVPIVMRPKSRGRVSLRSADPFEPPILEANYYEHPDDLATMVRGIKAAIAVASTRGFRRFNSTLLPVAFPGCKDLLFASDDYWACVARHVSTNLGHFISTCRMAPRERGGVVDARLRVHGLKGLRVADASIMPEMVAGHTCAPAYMIGEKAADLVKQDWGVLAPSADLPSRY